ncbi:MAG: hypothetical protein QOD06_2339 [Candidatus Binatota bacterium]|jgi:hypothetical protein|nr:hypothetical protein [Candidatus Binatota bacterium]
MRSAIAALVLISWMALSGTAMAVRDEYDDSQSHPFRVLAYILHPVGYALEWAIFRPLHYAVSATPETEEVFGHTAHGSDEVLIGTTAPPPNHP